MNIILKGDCTRSSKAKELIGEIGICSHREMIRISQEPDTVVTKSFTDALFGKILQRWCHGYSFIFETSVSPLTKSIVKNSINSVVPFASFSDAGKIAKTDFHLYYINKTRGTNPELKCKTEKSVPTNTVVAVLRNFVTQEVFALFNDGSVKWKTDKDVEASATLLDIGVVLSGIEKVKFIPITEGDCLEGHVCIADVTPVEYVKAQFKTKYKRTFVIKGTT